jgi:hypothetical protein
MDPDNVVAVAEVSESADGHVTEVIVAKPDDTTAAVSEDAPSAEEVVEAVLEAAGGTDGDATNVEVHDYVVVDQETGEEAYVEVIEYDAASDTADSSTETDSAFEVGATDTEASPETTDTPVEFDSATEAGPIDTAAEPVAAVETTDATTQTSSESETDTAAEAHATAATDAQAQADAAVDAGNYEAASQLRESAENEAWQAGDSSMLHGSTSAELDGAATHQAQAEGYEQQEAQHAASGDYEAARDDAANAANATGWADYQASGADHSGQANAEYDKEDWAVWEQHSAHDAEQNADSYAAQGDLDGAAASADSAAAHQEQADMYGHEGEHGAPDAVYDASSETDHSSIDAGAYDSGAAATTSYESDHSYDADAGVSAE